MRYGFLRRAAEAAAGNVHRWENQNLLISEPARDRRPTFLPGHGDGCGVIAEIKLRSPSRGPLMDGSASGAILEAYSKAGAEAVSVVVESQHFGGSPDLFREVAGRCDLPLLWKDFVVDPFQIRLAAHMGASAILLIAGLQPLDELCRLVEISREKDLRPLVEVHSEKELDMAFRAGADLVGINNRDLATLEVNLSLSERLAPRLVGDVQGVAESGMKVPGDVRRMADAGYRAVLVGTSLVTSDDPAGTLRAMVRAGRR